MGNSDAHLHTVFLSRIYLKLCIYCRWGRSIDKMFWPRIRQA